MDSPLAQYQIENFARQGFLVLSDPQIADSELQWCRDILLRLISEGKGRDEGRNFDLIAHEGGGEETTPQMLKPSLYARELLNFSFRRAGLKIAEQLLGPTAWLAGDVAVYKPSLRGGRTPWHQDEAFRESNFKYDEISIWIALTDTTLDNGPMAYIPGSHKLGILPHRLQGGSREANSIECSGGFNELTAVVCPIAAGAMIIHHGRTVHGALENKTGFDRLAYVLTFSTPVELRHEYRDFPWLKNLRSSVLRERKRALLKGGFVREVLRLLSYDLGYFKNALLTFYLRRVNSLRSLFRHRGAR